MGNKQPAGDLPAGGTGKSASATSSTSHQTGTSTDKPRNTSPKKGGAALRSLRLLHPVVTRDDDDDNMLVFHSRAGQNTEILNNNRTARRNTDSFNMGCVMTSRELFPGEIFQVVLEKIVDKWEGVIELGVTTHNPETIDYPSTLTAISGAKTWSWCGTDIIVNGCRRELIYGRGLDKIVPGDTVGFQVNNGNLHFYMNGVDQGVACSGIPDGVYGILDLYGSTAQISINEPEMVDSGSSLTFHPRCGEHVTMYKGTTAKRQASKFNYGIVFTKIALQPEQLFEVVIKDVTSKWTGSLEIGVTIFDPGNYSLTLPSTMTLAELDTWMFVGNSVMKDTKVISETYGDGTNLDVNDRVGVKVKKNGELHFFVNGRDLGCAAMVPTDGRLYGVVDMYGKVTEVVIPTSEAVVTDKTPEQGQVRWAMFATEEDIKLTIKTGDLVKEKVEVIVNTTSKSMNMQGGQLAKAVLAAAGKHIQTEVSEKAPKGAKESEVIQSCGGNMTWLKAIYHGAVADYDAGKGVKTLEDFIRNIFNLAHQNNIKSIALPAIGTGVLGFPPEVVAEVMVEQVTKFSQNHGRNTRLKDIRIVLYSGDMKTIKCFKGYMDGKTDVISEELSNTIQISLPDDWDKMSANKQCMLVKLQSGHREYDRVRDRFIEKGGPQTVTKIERIQSPNLYMLFMARRKTLQRTFPGKKFGFDRTLYHGTDLKAIGSINHNGFNKAYCGKNAARYGKGVYFAVEASYSAKDWYSVPDGTGTRRMYQCMVLTGEYTQGVPKLKAPPCKDPARPNELYNTVVDDVDNPKMYITFHDADAYPEYLISFTCT